MLKNDAGDVWFDDATTVGSRCLHFDLRSLLTSRPGVMFLLKVWPIKDTIMRPRPRCPALPSAGLARGFQPASSSRELALIGGSSDVGKIASACQVFTDAGALVERCTFIPFNVNPAFAGVAIDTLHRMEQLDMLQSRTDENGELTFSLNNNGLAWSVVRCLGVPKPVALVSLASDFSAWGKSSLILELKQRGWVEHFHVTRAWLSAPLVKDGVREFWRGAIKNTKWYYIALLMSDAIFAKGC